MLRTTIFATIAAVAALTGPAPLAAAPAPSPEPAAAFVDRFVDSMLERLASRPPAADVPAACFAPGTPLDYVTGVTNRLRGAGRLPFAAPALGKHRLDTRWSATASDGFGLSQGDPTTLTWSYVPDGTVIFGAVGEPTTGSQLFAWLNGIYGGFATWHALFEQVFDVWSSLTGLTYVYEPNDDGLAFAASPGVLGVRGDLRIGAHPIDGNSGILAYNYFPNNGDMVLDAFDSFYNNTASGSLGLRNVLAHEHGHGLGLEHVCPIDQTKLMEPFLTTAFDGPQYDDVLGGNRGYGDWSEHNDSAGNATDLGIAAGTAVLEVSIDDGGGEDWFRFAGSVGATVDVIVTPTGSPYLEGPQNGNGSCSAGTLFDPSARLDLAVEVVGPDGSTMLASANAAAAGGVETLFDVALGAGNHYVRVLNGDAVDRAQRYLVQVTITGAGALLFADGFESGDTAAWTQTVP